MKKLLTLTFIIAICFFATPVFADGKWTGTCSCYNGRKFQVDCEATQKSCQTLCAENNGSVSNNQCKYIETTNTNKPNNNSSGTTNGGSNGDAVDCGIVADITRPAARLIMIAAPILLLVMGAVDILTVVTSHDEKGMKKAWDNLIKRFIICVVIFLLPLLINFIIGWTTFNDLTACM